MSISQKSLVLGEEFDPLLKDLDEKKQNFKRNVVSLAAELNEVRNRLVLQEQSIAREILTRQEAEDRAKDLEVEMNILQQKLEEKNGELLASASSTEKLLIELDVFKSQLASAQETADASSASAKSARLQYFALLKEVDQRNKSLKEYEEQVERLGKRLNNVQKDLQMREYSQKQLKDEILRVEQDIMQALELKTVLDEVSPENIEKMNKLLTVKDEEMVRLRDEIRIMSSHWKRKSNELESQDS